MLLSKHCTCQELDIENASVLFSTLVFMYMYLKKVFDDTGVKIYVDLETWPRNCDAFPCSTLLSAELQCHRSIKIIQKKVGMVKFRL